MNGKRLAVSYHYTGLGYLHFLGDDSQDYAVLWQAAAMDAFGQIVDESTRNGVETVLTRNPSIGWLMATASTARLDGGKLIQNWGYTYDEAGNLLSRSRADEVSPNPSIETFTYDSLNRVLTSRVTIPLQGYDASDAFVFDSLGNLTQKGGKVYAYNAGCVAGTRPAGPHAVCTVASGAPYVYDADQGHQRERGVQRPPIHRTHAWNQPVGGHHLAEECATGFRASTPTGRLHDLSGSECVRRGAGERCGRPAEGRRVHRQAESTALGAGRQPARQAR